MLDQLRKHASNWLIKTVLTLIILTFMFFFGYTRFAQRYQSSESYVAQVGDHAISRRKFENMVQSSQDRMRENMKGELPENISQLLRKNVLDQMITREAIVQFADSLGLTVSDEELANAIRSNKSLFPDGNFDIEAYEKKFLPSYSQHYGEDYETTVRRDLLVEKTQVLMISLFSPWQDELESSLDEIRKSKKEDEKKNAKAETQETRPTAVESMSPLDLFSTWLNGFRDTLKIKVFDRS